MQINKKSYQDYTKRHAPKSRLGKNSLLAFLIGGSICTLGEFFKQVYSPFLMDPDVLSSSVSITLIFLSCLATSLGIYDHLAKYAGAGTLVPITGFANATISPALDAKSEGWILGIGAKVFTVAGPVILYGVSASVVYGLIYWIL